MASLYLVVEGDSLSAENTAGQATNGNYWPNQLAWKYAANGQMVSITNCAVSGEQLQTMVTQGAAQVDAAFDSRKSRMYVVLWAGTNDIAAGGRTAAQVWTDMQTWVTARRAAAASASTTIKVIGISMLPRGNFTAPQATERNSFNVSFLASGTTVFDAIVDTTADSRLQNSGDTTYFNADTIHLNNTGYTIITSLVKTKLDALLVS